MSSLLFRIFAIAGCCVACSSQSESGVEGGGGNGGVSSSSTSSLRSSAGGVSSGGAESVPRSISGGAGMQSSSLSSTSSSSSATGGSVASGGSQSSGGSSATTSEPTAVINLPEGNAPFDYQIGGVYSPPNGVKVVSRDRNSAPAPGLYNICYVNGFQTQPDEASFWEGERADLILKDGSGSPVIDPDWNELLLDTSTETKRSRLAQVVGDWIAKCKTDGFDAVEIDNLDSYSRSGGRLTEDNNVSLMRQFANVAHANGLAIAQKNSVELLGRVDEMQTDFAVAEECNRWSECSDYKTAYGARVFVIEYRSEDFTKGCDDFPELSIVLRDLDVTTPASGDYVYQGC